MEGKERILSSSDLLSIASTVRVGRPKPVSYNSIQVSHEDGRGQVPGPIPTAFLDEFIRKLDQDQKRYSNMGC